MEEGEAHPFLADAGRWPQAAEGLGALGSLLQTLAPCPAQVSQRVGMSLCPSLPRWPLHSL